MIINQLFECVEDSILTCTTVALSSFIIECAIALIMALMTAMYYVCMYVLPATKLPLINLCQLEL